jgi:hypothetical protein
MSNITKYFLGIFALGALVFSILLITSTRKSFVNKLENANAYSNRTLENKMHRILESSIEQSDIIPRLCLNGHRLCFMYSSNECGTCIDHALVDLYVLSKCNVFSKEIIVLTPERDDREIKKLSLKYDNLLKFVSLDHEVWDSYSSILNGINSVYFITNSDLSIGDCYVFNPHNDKSNQLYYDFIKKKYNL